MEWISFITVVEYLVFALVVGVIAKLVMPGKDPGRLIGTTVIGIAGGVVGGCLGRQAGFTGESEIIGFVWAVIGSLGVLLLYRWLTA